MPWPSTGLQKTLWLGNSKIHHERKLTVTSSKCISKMIYHRQVIFFKLAKSLVSHESGRLESVTNASVAAAMSLCGMRKDRKVPKEPIIHGTDEEAVTGSTVSLPAALLAEGRVRCVFPICYSGR